MNRADSLRQSRRPAIRRLNAIAPLSPAALAILESAADRAIDVPARRELTAQGRKVPLPPLLLLEGWAARVRIMADGRRQLISFVLPGDLIGNCGYDEAVSVSTIVALTQVSVCPLPHHGDPYLDRAYAISRAIDEAHLIAQIVRLGRLAASERVIDLFLELNERLELAGLADAGRFTFPLTQEVVADVLGLTAVHVNRMVQQARKRGELSWTGRTIRLTDVNLSHRSVDREITRVS